MMYRVAAFPWAAWRLRSSAPWTVASRRRQLPPKLLRNALEALRKTGLVMYFTASLGELAHALGQSGATDEALAAIDEGLQRSEVDEERWCVAELLRIRGELLVSRHAADAETHFRQAC